MSTDWRAGSLFSGGGLMDHAVELAGFQVQWQSEIDADACAVLARHWPEVPNYGDVTSIDPEQLAAVDLIFGGSPCFVAGTLVLTNRGLIPIEQVQVGDLVLTHKNRWRPVEAVMQRRAPTLFVKGQGHPGIRTTVNHPFWARIKTRHYQSVSRRAEIQWHDPHWVAAKDLLGQRWASPTIIPALPIPAIHVQGREPSPPVFTPAFFWFVGAWLGDGWVDLHQRPHRSPGQVWGHIFIGVDPDDADELAERLGQVGLRFYQHRERTTIRFRISHRPLARWLDAQFGRYSHGKHLPAWIYGMPQTWRQALWDGYCWTDGHRYSNGVQVSSVSRALVFGTKLLVQTLGMTGYVHNATPHREACVIEGRTVSERPILALRVYDAPKSGYHDDGMVWQLVRDVQLTGEIEHVYNLEVAEDHSYTADGIVVHNCQSFSVSGHRKGLAGESGLFWEFLRIADAQPGAWVLWENVPGVLSIDAGQTFALILWGFTGYWPQVPAGGWRRAGFCAGPKRTVAWRVLDAQYFGVPQARRRLFLVGHPVDRTDCVQVLFEPESLPGAAAPRRQAGQITPTLTASGAGATRAGFRDAEFLGALCDVEAEVLALRLAHSGAQGPMYKRRTSFTLDTTRNFGIVAPVQRSAADENPMQDPGDNISRARAHPVTMSHQRPVARIGPAYTTQASRADFVMTTDYAPRVYLPIEVERLQGIPDDWTRWDDAGRELSDTVRHRIVGNGVAVPVVQWIARRIALALSGELEAADAAAE